LVTVQKSSAPVNLSFWGMLPQNLEENLVAEYFASLFVSELFELRGQILG
jgi:hypothetical protein